ncbi:hypothetical protein PV341_35580 [Streptomyces sp. PA03-1a]|nr:hypothetical protein [Streptomyces sp. PA03-1a]
MTVRSASARIAAAVACRAVLAPVLAVCAVLAVCVARAAGVPGILGGPGPALTGAFLLGAGVCGVRYAVRPR